MLSNYLRGLFETNENMFHIQQPIYVVGNINVNYLKWILPFFIFSSSVIKQKINRWPTA